MTTWEDYNTEIDRMRMMLTGRTLLDFTTDFEEAMTRYGVRDLDERYKAVHGMNQIFSVNSAEETREIIELIEGCMHGDLDYDPKGCFMAILEKAKSEA